MPRSRPRFSRPPSVAGVAGLAAVQGVGFGIATSLIEGGTPWSIAFRVGFFGGCMFAFGMLSRRRQLTRQAAARAQRSAGLR